MSSEAKNCIPIKGKTEMSMGVRAQWMAQARERIALRRPLRSMLLLCVCACIPYLACVAGNGNLCNDVANVVENLENETVLQKENAFSRQSRAVATEY
jgi:hypothetical protein